MCGIWLRPNLTTTLLHFCLDLDIKIEIEITSRSGERLSDKEKFIAKCYLDARTDEAIELRDHFEKSLFEVCLSVCMSVFLPIHSIS